MKMILKFCIWTGLLFTIIMLYCYYNYQFWTHLSIDNLNTLTEFKSENIKGFRGKQILIHYKFNPYMIEIDKYAQKNQVELIINQSYRNSRQQLTKTVVKATKMSNHLAGFAIDFNLKYNNVKYFSKDLKLNNLAKLPKNIQNFINDIRDDKNLRWGGMFIKEDPIHIDYPINLKSKKYWLEYSKLCNQDYIQGTPKWKSIILAFYIKALSFI